MPDTTTTPWLDRPAPVRITNALLDANTWHAEPSSNAPHEDRPTVREFVTGLVLMGKYPRTRAQDFSIFVRQEACDLAMCAWRGDLPFLASSRFEDITLLLNLLQRDVRSIKCSWEGGTDEIDASDTFTITKYDNTTLVKGGPDEPNFQLLIHDLIYSVAGGGDGDGTIWSTDCIFDLEHDTWVVDEPLICSSTDDNEDN